MNQTTRRRNQRNRIRKSKRNRRLLYDALEKRMLLAADLNVEIDGLLTDDTAPALAALPEATAPILASNVSFDAGANVDQELPTLTVEQLEAQQLDQSDQQFELVPSQGDDAVSSDPAFECHHAELANLSCAPNLYSDDLAIYQFPNLITESDPTNLQSLTYQGRGVRNIYDSRTSASSDVNVYLFDAKYENGELIEIQVNPELGSASAAEREAEILASAIGRIPDALQERFVRAVIHGGTPTVSLGGLNDGVIIQSPTQWIGGGFLEEVLLHEGTHVSLDTPFGLDNEEWVAAQQADNFFASQYAQDFPEREDLAETMVVYYASRAVPGRISSSELSRINSALSNRFEYLDSLNLELGIDRRLDPILAADNTFTLPDTSDGAFFESEPLLSNDSGNGRLTVTAVNGSSANLNTTISLASGGNVYVADDGKISFNADGDFDYLGSGEVAFTQFEYTIRDDQNRTDTATATIRVTGSGSSSNSGNADTGDEFGNSISRGGSLDGWDSNLVLNLTDTYTNNSGRGQQVALETFNFYARANDSAITPFAARVNSGTNDFTVLAIGSTHTSFNRGQNFVEFFGGAKSVVNLAPGEELAFGFIDANAYGVGGTGSVVSFDNGGDSVWYSGGRNGSDSGSLRVNQAPIAGSSTFNLNRSYNFSVGITVEDGTASSLVRGVSAYSGQGANVDGWKSNLVINESSVYTNNSGETQTIGIDRFTFNAKRTDTPVTPFVVRVNGDNDFTVLSVGSTRTNYNVGINNYSFHFRVTQFVELQPGETLAVGFLDANSNGSNSTGSAISFDNGGSEIWYTGGRNSSDSGSVGTGRAPTPGSRTVTSLKRDYKFTIGFTPYSALQAAEDSSRVNLGNADLVSSIEQDDVAQLTDAAIDYWVDQGISKSTFDNVSIVVTDLGRNLLGLQGNDTIYIDDDAAGFGWYVDQNPLTNEAFSGMDLLTVLTHELGHAAGFADLYQTELSDDVMFGFLESGERRVDLETSPFDSMYSADPGIELGWLDSDATEEKEDSQANQYDPLFIV